MVFDWFAREGGMVLSWWLLVTLAGAAVFPLCIRLLGSLPDKGFTLARAVGLLLVGYVFWLLGSFGFLKNTTGSIILSWLIVLLLSLVVYFRLGQGFDWRTWWRANRAGIVVGEVAFFVMLLGWAIIRAHQNEIGSTEKPMDLMFMSSIMRSPTFPPNDGWLAGYSISYYYFGYFIMAMLANLSGVISTIGYNLAVALLFALTGLTTYGVVYNLVRSRQIGQEISRRFAPILTGLIALVMVTLMGNFQVALVELPYQTRAAPEWYLSLTGTQSREAYPEREQARAAGIPDDQAVTLSPGSADPGRWEYWWWFRSSRVLNDFDLTGQVMPNWYAQPIDEFPQFSFLLADNHPHVMALPFVLLALGLALNLVLAGRDPKRAELLLYGLAVGGLIFLNTWDGPIYMAALVGADGLRRLMRGQGRLSQEDWFRLAGFGGSLLLIAVVFYLPFLISFRSQAAGLLPNIITPTSFPQLFIMFGPFLLILAFFLWHEARLAGKRLNWRLGLQASLGLLIALMAVTGLLIVLAALLVPEALNLVNQFVAPFGGLLGALPQIFARRLQGGVTLLLLLLGFGLIVARLFPSSLFSKRKRSDDDAELSHDDRVLVTYSPETGFALMLVALGIGLVVVPEFFFLRDNFSTRINTIFKFYYQAWVLFSIASAYAIWSILSSLRVERPVPAVRVAFSAVVVLAIGAGMLYPLFGIYSRNFVESGYANGTNTRPLTLDGGPSMIAASDYQSIECFRQQIGDRQLVVAEALGGAYNPAFGRVAGLTGVPIVLGWENHQRQWRGPTYNQVVTSRPQDIPALYQDARWEVAAEIIQRHGIDYIFFGTSERQQYGSGGEEKFIENLTPICAMLDGAGRVQSVFYEVPPTLVAAR